MGKQYNLCIISESKSAKKPESFIRAHKELLSGNVHFLYGSTLPLYSEKNGSLADYPSLLERIINKFRHDNLPPLKRGLIKYLKDNKIDMVLAEYGTTGAQVFPICKELNIPLIVHFHGYDISKYELIDWHRELYRQMFRYATKIIAVSKDMKEDLIKAGADSDKIVVNPYGPNKAFYEISPNYLSGNFLAVGRFVDKKAPYYTILAFNVVLKDFPSLKLVMIGGGYLLNSCRNLVKFLKLEDKVIIKGNLSHEELRKYFSDAFCFVQHSVIAEDGDSEGTPVGILEAGAVGLPAISTRHKGIKEAIVHEQTGYLIEEHDVEDMISRMRQIAENRQKAEELGKNAKLHILQNYSMDKHIEIINNIILETLTG